MTQWQPKVLTTMSDHQIQSLNLSVSECALEWRHLEAIIQLPQVNPEELEIDGFANYCPFRGYVPDGRLVSGRVVRGRDGEQTVVIDTVFNPVRIRAIQKLIEQRMGELMFRGDSGDN